MAACNVSLERSHPRQRTYNDACYVRPLTHVWLVQCNNSNHIDEAFHHGDSSEPPMQPAVRLEPQTESVGHAVDLAAQKQRHEIRDSQRGGSFEQSRPHHHSG